MLDEKKAYFYIYNEIINKIKQRQHKALKCIFV